MIFINFLFVSYKWENYYENWSKLNENYRKLFIIDMKQKKINFKTLRWFYGFMLGALLTFCLNFTKGLTAVCWEDYKSKSIDKLLFQTAYVEFFEAVDFDFEYHMAFGFFFMFLDFVCNTAWCFNDLFIISISIMLERCFSLVNSRISMNTKVRDKNEQGLQT